MMSDEKRPTYELVSGPRGKAIRCLLCLHLSYNPHDIEHRYCGRCRTFHDIDAQKKEIAESIRGHLERKKGK